MAATHLDSDSTLAPAIAVFTSAFLLFQLELVIGKHVLPWYGGAPAVWTTCMLFFQVALLAGYGWAHWLGDRLDPARQRAAHLAALALGVAVIAAQWAVWGLPLLPPPAWRPSGDADPASGIVRLLAVAVGVPFVVLAATGPLVQRWAARIRPGRSPYRLYALSNLGSLLGLLSFPLVVEPRLRLGSVAVLWGGGFAAFAIACGRVAQRQARRATAALEPRDLADEDARRPRLADVALWLALPCAAVVMLLAVTNQICQEIAVVPLLWVLPLAIYLGTFVVCFQHERAYRREVCLPLLVAGAALACVLLYRGVDVAVPLQVAGWSAVLAACCMSCHGELARLAPTPRRLTAFYLVVAGGGALGGVLVAVAAPLVFNGYWELHAGLAACCALAVLALLADRTSWLREGRTWPALAALLAAAGGTAALFWSAGAATGGGAAPLAPSVARLAAPLAGALVLLLLLGRRMRRSGGGRSRPIVGVACLAIALSLLSLVLRAHLRAAQAAALVSRRDFFGVVSVDRDAGDNALGPALYLRHGRIVHGFQLTDPALRALPTAYFGERSGIGLALRFHSCRAGAPAERRPLRIGVVGLGIGTLAAYGAGGDLVRFYEISPAVIRLASGRERVFTYLEDARARVEVVPGDGRVSLERELRDPDAPRFDVLAMDAFSGAAVPLHLLTREAFATYLARLDPERGILAVNISNRNVDLQGVVRRLAAEFGLSAVEVEGARSADGAQWHSLWALLTRDLAFLRVPDVAAASRPLPAAAPAPLWTDDHSSLLDVVEW